MTGRLRRGRRWLLATDHHGHHNHPGTPDRAVQKRPRELPLEVQGELGEANERVVAVFLLRPNLRRVLVPMPFWSATTVGW